MLGCLLFFFTCKCFAILIFLLLEDFCIFSHIAFFYFKKIYCIFVLQKNKTAISYFRDEEGF